MIARSEDVQFLRDAWYAVDVPAVEARFGLTYDYPHAPADEPAPEEWRVQHARKWIENVRHQALPRHTIEVLAKRLIIAHLEPDSDVRAMYVEMVRADSGLTPDYFALADQAAGDAAAQYAPQSRNRVRKALLAELDALVPA